MRCSAPRDVLELTPGGISHATRVRALIQATVWYTSSRYGKVRDDRRRVNLPARPSQTRPRARCGIIRLCTRVLDHVVDALQSSARRARRADSGDCIVDSHAESLAPLGYKSGADFAASLWVSPQLPRSSATSNLDALRDDADQAALATPPPPLGCWPSVAQCAMPVGAEISRIGRRRRGRTPAVVPYAFARECSTARYFASGLDCIWRSGSSSPCAALSLTLSLSLSIGRARLGNGWMERWRGGERWKGGGGGSGGWGGGVVGSEGRRARGRQ